MTSSIDDTVASIETGIKLAFSNSITAMFSTSLWIILLGFFLSLFIPVIALNKTVAEKNSDETLSQA